MTAPYSWALGHPAAHLLLHGIFAFPMRQARTRLTGFKVFQTARLFPIEPAAGDISIFFKAKCFSHTQNL